MGVVGVEVCDICQDVAKYRCPRCDSRSCSLDCVKQHKKLSGCDGLRHKTKYVRLKDFTELDLISDYRVLENATSAVDKCRRDKLKKLTRQAVDGFCAPRLAKSIQKLQTAASRHGTRVKILPPHFVKRKKNTSHFDYKTKVLFWHVDLVFVNLNQTLTFENIPDTTKMWKLLAEVLEPETEDRSRTAPAPAPGCWENPVPQDQLDLYRGVGYGGLSLFLKSESLRQEGEETLPFYPMEQKRSLRYNLRDRTLVEHPVIYVVFKSDDCNFRSEEKTSNLDYEEEMHDEAKGAEPDFPQSVGDVLGEEENMSADPEAYAEYYSFYLKYYTQKYSRHPPPTHLAGVLTGDPNVVPSAENMFKQIPKQVHPPAFQKPQQPHYFDRTENPPSHLGNNPRVDTTRNPRSAGAPNIPSSGVGKSKINPEAVNISNLENAKRLQAEIRQETKNSGLGLLAAYSDSDGDE